MLTAENYQTGFLIDEDCMGGVAAHPEKPGIFVSFLLQYTTGEYIHFQSFHQLSEALQDINQMSRQWSYEKIGSCGSSCQTSTSCGCSKAEPPSS